MNSVYTHVTIVIIEEEVTNLRGGMVGIGDGKGRMVGNDINAVLVHEKKTV